jgi:hypothetical protein
MATQSLSVQFHDQTLTAILVDDNPCVAMKPICENIGLQWEGQLKRLNRHPVLKSTMSMMDIVAEDGKRRKMVTLPLEFLNGWLFSIDATRAKPEIRPRLIEYQRECFKVLAAHFMTQAFGPKQLSEPPTITRTQQGELATMVANKSEDCGRPRAYFWSRFQNHFKIASYKDLPAERFDEAVDYLRRLEGNDRDAFMMLSHRELCDILRQNGKLSDRQADTVIPGATTVQFSLFDNPDQPSRFYVNIHGKSVTVQPIPEGAAVVSPENLKYYLETHLPDQALISKSQLKVLKAVLKEVNNIK